MTPSNQDLSDLAKEIFVQRIARLGASDWDFRPHAKTAFTAAKEFFLQVQEEFPQPISLAPAEPPSNDPHPEHPGAPEMPLPANQLPPVLIT